MTKSCSMCHEVKSEDGFGNDRSTPTGLKSRCKSCEKQYLRAYYDKNTDTIKDRASKWYDENKVLTPRKVMTDEERAEAGRRSASSSYYRNLDRNRARNRSRMSIRHRLVRNSVTDDPSLKFAWEVLTLFYGEMCMYPECYKTDKLHLDHIVPLSRGGSHEYNNWQILCQFHNIQKGARNSNDYRLVDISKADVDELIFILKVKEEIS